MDFNTPLRPRRLNRRNGSIEKISQDAYKSANLMPINIPLHQSPPRVIERDMAPMSLSEFLDPSDYQPEPTEPKKYKRVRPMDIEDMIGPRCKKISRKKSKRGPKANTNSDDSQGIFTPKKETPEKEPKKQKAWENHKYLKVEETDQTAQTAVFQPADHQDEKQENQNTQNQPQQKYSYPREESPYQKYKFGYVGQKKKDIVSEEQGVIGRSDSYLRKKMVQHQIAHVENIPANVRTSVTNLGANQLVVEETYQPPQQVTTNYMAEIELIPAEESEKRSRFHAGRVYNVQGGGANGHSSHSTATSVLDKFLFNKERAGSKGNSREIRRSWRLN